MKDELNEKLLQSEEYIRQGLENITNLLNYKPDESGLNKNMPKAVITFVLIKEELLNILNKLETAKNEYIKLENKKFEKIIYFPSWKNFSDKK